jgi:hypothetical protein
MRTAALPELLPGFARRTEAPHAAPHPLRPLVTPLSGALALVTGAAGQDVHLHRAGYTRPTPDGGWTLHGYVWRCPACPRLSRPFGPAEFADALQDAGAHHCGSASWLTSP